MTTPLDARRARHHARLSSLIEFARREGWEVSFVNDRLLFVKAGLPPIFAHPALDARALLHPEPDTQHA